MTFHTVSKKEFLEMMFLTEKMNNIEFEIRGKLPEEIPLKFDIYIGKPEGEHYLYKVVR
jgi:hypothetical protein